MVVPQYCYTQEKAAGLLAECNEEADSIAEKIRNSRLSTYDSVIRVHDILARKVKYEYDLSYEDHSIVGALLTQTKHLSLFWISWRSPVCVYQVTHTTPAAESGTLTCGTWCVSAGTGVMSMLPLILRSKASPQYRIFISGWTICR